MLPSCPKRHPVSAAESDSRHARRLDGCHQLLVHHAAEHHQRDIASLGVRDSQAIHKFTLFAELLENTRQCLTAAVHHSYPMSILSQLCDRSRALAQNFRFVESCSPNFHHDCHCRPSSSPHAYIRFMFCTACPAAPFSRLSMQETSTSRRPSSARQNPRSQ